MLLPWELEGDLPLSLPFRFLHFPERPAQGSVWLRARHASCSAQRPGERAGQAFGVREGAVHEAPPGRGVTGLLKTLKCALRALGALLLGTGPAESPASIPVCPEQGPVFGASAGAASKGRAGPHGTDRPAGEEWSQNPRRGKRFTPINRSRE